MTGLLFLHGWGFGPDAWTEWTRAFPDRPIALLNAGYYTPERMTVPPNPDGWVGIGHSLGFARLLAMDVPWRGLIGLGAFLRFCSATGQDSGTPPETLDAMITRLDVDPADVLARFLRRSGVKGSRPSSSSTDDCELLRRDLLTLRHLNLSAPHGAPPIFLLHAADDRIAPLALAQEAHAKLKDSLLHVFESGGHALPFTRTADCLALVREFLHDAA
ncbi:MAG: alpha/beta hydrolase [Humidesulfovibrio sp.]|jgi:pimeloyl-ACP methyl ester carboxylesterase|uniref:alpha/beta fold hydrolase n=1 Tax=Humidesulfovibrio sp. TaxID=2910988 RepID=UPI00273351D6|nr:alpha/beta hydrolase [Humidesulfovibrio sp.]MDP2848085.1 alpha/beta hydrolase [Humidesulfovibrio sp.]